MDTLGLTALTMLIPMGWAIASDAYPQTIEGSGSTHNTSQVSACHFAQRPDPAAEHEDEVATAINKAREAVRTFDSTAELHETRSPLGEISRLEFAPVEID